MMLQTLKSPLFIICSILFLLHQLLQYGLNINIPFADNFLDNLLAMPIILILLLAERRWLFRKGPDYHLSMLEILITTFYVSLISELVFPRLSSRFTFHWLDFVFFFAGTGLYLLLEHKKTVRPESGMETKLD